MPESTETSAELLAGIQRERATLEELVSTLDDGRMTASARDDGWTPKDILAHLTAWEQRLLRWFERWRKTGDPGRPEVGVTWEGMDSINQQEYEESVAKSLDEVSREAEDSHAQVVRIVEAIADEELATTPEAPDGPSWSWIIRANTWRHYQEHRQEMEAWRGDDIL
jgi:hypothetical protein